MQILTVPQDMIIHQCHSIANISKMWAIDVNPAASPHCICDTGGVKECLYVPVIRGVSENNARKFTSAVLNSGLHF